MEGGCWNQTARLVPTMTVAIYFSELIFVLALAIMLLAASTFKFSIAALPFCCGLVAWTLAEYVTHRFVLHAIAPVQHGNITPARKTASTRCSGKYGSPSASSTCGGRCRSGRRSHSLRLVSLSPLLRRS